MEIFSEALFKTHLYGLTIYVHPKVYAPSDDTYLLIDSLELSGGEIFLDLGSGTGIVGIYAAKRGAKEVFQIDINPYAAILSKCNSHINFVDKVTHVVVGDLLTPLRGHVEFDIIAFNPPYLPVQDKGLLEKSWSGGASGREVIDKFLDSFHEYLKYDGEIYVVGSSLSNYDLTLKALERKRYRWKIVSKKRFFFEEIVVIKAWRHIK